MSLPEFHSEPMRVARLTDHCPTCAREFVVHGYSGQDLHGADSTLTALVRGHVRRDHPKPTPSAADGAGEFQIYEDRGGRWRFRLHDANGAIVASGEAYETWAAAKRGCESVQAAADGAEIVEA